MCDCGSCLIEGKQDWGQSCLKWWYWLCLHIHIVHHTKPNSLSATENLLPNFGTKPDWYINCISLLNLVLYLADLYHITLSKIWTISSFYVAQLQHDQSFNQSINMHTTDNQITNQSISTFNRSVNQSVSHFIGGSVCKAIKRLINRQWIYLSNW